MNNTVDLGLPSGTLWCKYNVGCDYELLEYNSEKTKPKDWYGNYYTWGELEPKTNYTWDTYKYAQLVVKYYKYAYMDAQNYKFTKYCADNKPRWAYNGKTDGFLSTLESADDIATVKCSTFRMPTKKEVEELFSLPNKWVKNYNDISGLNDRLFIGNNDNTLFIPAAGFYKERM